jgi:hypothetical protein
MIKSSLIFILIMTICINSFGQEIIDPVEVPYFVINRKSANVVLPKTLGGRGVKGFAGITISVNSSGRLLSTEIKKLKLSGKVNLSYQLGQDVKNDTIQRYEAFLKKCVSEIKIIKTDKRKPPKINNITFIIRF